ncbi:uncharacterized protein LY89DRAFT_746036 [Mollisia scopiformis]|uniref:Uncharacterized protein n=1 Tax=Mollisia scopiformis TaxID=149040 RepID=A0A194XCU6_MOLSC|nr:uncharacterized protein LY89DRAFT_746036 [Mollisia scopiformis]KUJ17993.1 hypothetical protein LY89DRAFT_746036 [Mollisia scopiformis]
MNKNEEQESAFTNMAFHIDNNRNKLSSTSRLPETTLVCARRYPNHQTPNSITNQPSIGSTEQDSHRLLWHPPHLPRHPIPSTISSQLLPLPTPLPLLPLSIPLPSTSYPPSTRPSPPPPSPVSPIFSINPPHLPPQPPNPRADNPQQHQNRNDRRCDLSFIVVGYWFAI